MSFKRNPFAPLSAKRAERLLPGLRLMDVAVESGVSLSKLSRCERNLAQLTDEEDVQRREAIARLSRRSHGRGAAQDEVTP